VILVFLDLQDQLDQPDSPEIRDREVFRGKMEQLVEQASLDSRALKVQPDNLDLMEIQACRVLLGYLELLVPLGYKEIEDLLEHCHQDKFHLEETLEYKATLDSQDQRVRRVHLVRLDQLD